MHFPAPETIQDLVTMAFCLEPLSDKRDCTTRYHDIPGKPLSDFIIAGINSGKYFRYLAESIKKNDSAPIFNYLVPALQQSNTYKSSKTINLGLLEIMFLVVYARLQCDRKDKILDTINVLLQRQSTIDVQHLIDGRHEAWKSSQNFHKQHFDGEYYRSSGSPYQFYEQLKSSSLPDSSSYQWAEQCIHGWPILRDLFISIKGSDNLLVSAARVCNLVHQEQPDIRVGIIADMCAAALFLEFSFR